NQVWVRWQERPNLLFSGPGDRHYMIDRSRGRLIFGNGRHGRIPPAGADNIHARRYRSGGGVDGNVPTGTITRLLGGVVAQGVTNPRAADGGADGELAESAPEGAWRAPRADQPAGGAPGDERVPRGEPVLVRGPRTFRHRRQALSADDYEALAREA